MFSSSFSLFIVYININILLVQLSERNLSKGCGLHWLNTRFVFKVVLYLCTNFGAFI